MYDPVEAAINRESAEQEKFEEELASADLSAEEVARLTEAMGWDREELARQCNVDYRTVCRWLSGQGASGAAAQLIRLLHGLHSLRERYTL